MDSPSDDPPTTYWAVIKKLTHGKRQETLRSQGALSLLDCTSTVVAEVVLVLLLALKALFPFDSPFASCVRIDMYIQIEQESVGRRLLARQPRDTRQRPHVCAHQHQCAESQDKRAEVDAPTTRCRRRPRLS